MDLNISEITNAATSEAKSFGNPDGVLMDATVKHKRLCALMELKGIEAIWLQRVSSFAWATSGATGAVNTATSTGPSSVLITPEDRYVVTTNFEARRLEQEDGLMEQGWKLCLEPWHRSKVKIGELTRGLRLGTDIPVPNAVDLSRDIALQRTNLTPLECHRVRVLGKICAQAMHAAIQKVRPGQTEFEIAAHLSQEMQARGAQPIIILIGADERISLHRHPLPTAKRLERYAMLVVGGRKWGLVCSMTRFVHFGPLPDEARRKMEACARVAATFNVATRPGVQLSAIFERAAEAYATTGFGDEWQLHHQGGISGYEPREFLATPTAAEVVALDQMYGWNPTITGVKAEDMLLVGETGNEVLTTIPGWPCTRTVTEKQWVDVPAILEVV